MEPGHTTRRRGATYSALGTAAVFAGALTYIGLRDPHAPGFGFPACPFHLLTGWNCPGCGGLRMTHDLLHGDLSAAVMDNAFMLVALPVLASWLIVRWLGGHKLMPRYAVAVLTVAAVTWTVIRNLPGFPLVPTLIAG
ncbi:MAG: hypothetical protein JWR11_805 [Mycobacterium sp.]|nr:hypothetical protein [Mycobacterium sp.]